MKLLIIEDEPSLLESICEYLKRESYICETASSFMDGSEKIHLYDYDCILLDISLPGGNGLKLLQDLRQQKKQDGVIIISAKNSLDDKLEGLGLGADDYLTKPFHLSELNARIKALLRRKYSGGTDRIQYNGLIVDLSSCGVVFNEQPVVLTRIEFQLLVFLCSNKERIVSKQAIAEHLLGYEADNLDSYYSVYAHIKNLKRKLRDAGCPVCMKVIYGLGYKFEIA